MQTVILYTKPGCHLCDDVQAVIRSVARRRPLKLVERNILDDLADLERYHDLIPVVTVDGREIARYRLTVAQLEAALDGDV
jgi:hypothetical protein